MPFLGILPKSYYSNSYYFLASALCLISAVTVCPLLAQESSNQKDSARALLNSSMDFLRQKLEQSSYALTENDILQIKREGNTFLIPKHLRLKGLLNLPIIEQQIEVRKVAYVDPNSVNKDKVKKTTGFQIHKLKTNSIFKVLGVTAGDILHKVNNQSIRDAKSATNIFNQLKLSDLVSVTFIRNKSAINFIYKFV